MKGCRMIEERGKGKRMRGDEKKVEKREENKEGIGRKRE